MDLSKQSVSGLLFFIEIVNFVRFLVQGNKSFGQGMFA